MFFMNPSLRILKEGLTLAQRVGYRGGVEKIFQLKTVSLLSVEKMFFLKI